MTPADLFAADSFAGVLDCLILHSTISYLRPLLAQDMKATFCEKRYCAEALRFLAGGAAGKETIPSLGSRSLVLLARSRNICRSQRTVCLRAAKEPADSGLVEAIGYLVLGLHAGGEVGEAIGQWQQLLPPLLYVTIEDF